MSEIIDTLIPPPEPAARAVGLPLGRRPTARLALRSRRVQFGGGLVIGMIAIALIGPHVAPHSPDAIGGIPFQGTSPGMPLGADYLGRDVLSRVLAGGQALVWMSLASAAIGMLLGVPAGMLAAYYGGWRDELIMRGSDVLLALPVIVFALLFVSLLGTELWLIVLLIGISHAPQVARVTRGITEDVTQREFIQSAIAIGIKGPRLLFGEILPNIITPLTVEFGLRVVWSISAVAGLSVLGAGMQPPAADWGLMVSENANGMAVQPLGVVVPIICIGLFAVGFNLLTEGIARTVAGIDRRRSAE
jgi:peptide/nickel transport system permease protein